MRKTTAEIISIPTTSGNSNKAGMLASAELIRVKLSELEYEALRIGFVGAGLLIENAANSLNEDIQQYKAQITNQKDRYKRLNK